MSTVDNIVCLSDGRYLVWTQAGFKKAMKHLFATHGEEDPVEGFPNQYPSVVRFYAHYRGYHYWHAVCIPLNDAVERAKAAVSELTDADERHRAQLNQLKLEAGNAQSTEEPLS